MAQQGGGARPIGNRYRREEPQNSRRARWERGWTPALRGRLTKLALEVLNWPEN